MRTSLLITIPFVLLLNSDRVVVSTHMYGDLSGTRAVQSTGDSSLADEIRTWTREMTRAFDDAGTHVTGDAVVAVRSAQRNDLGDLDGAQADAADIVQEPFSLITTYTWTDTITINYLGNDKEQAAAPLTDFEYRLTMPGVINSTDPPAEVNGRTAVWRLGGDQEEQTISASATTVRWDAVIILVYVVGYLAWRLTAFLAHRARLRPRKI